MRKINRLTREVAAEVLNSFMYCSSAEDVKRVSERVMAKYGLYKDPFSGYPCSLKEYRKKCRQATLG